MKRYRNHLLGHASKGIVTLCVMYGCSYGKHSPNHV
jgi:hypothetical protein